MAQIYVSGGHLWCEPLLQVVPRQISENVEAGWLDIKYDRIAMKFDKNDADVFAKFHDTMPR